MNVWIRGWLIHLEYLGISVGCLDCLHSSLVYIDRISTRVLPSVVGTWGLCTYNYRLLVNTYPLRLYHVNQGGLPWGIDGRCRDRRQHALEGRQKVVKLQTTGVRKDPPTASLHQGQIQLGARLSIRSAFVQGSTFLTQPTGRYESFLPLRELPKPDTCM